MAKYAIIWTTTNSYMPGTNANLNALEFYGFDVDAYVLYDEISDDYKAHFPKVNFSQMTVWSEHRDSYWYCVFSDLKYAVDNLFDNYDVVLFWGGDVCIVDNFMEYFEVAHKLNRIVAGTNEHHGEGPINLPEKQPYTHTWMVPWADIPFFVPSTKRKVIENTLSYQYIKGATVDRMDGLNYAIRDEKENVFGVLGHMWVMNCPYWGKIERSGNNLLLFGSKMKSFHRKYWSKEYAKNYADGNEISKNNATMFNYMYRFLNNQRVKWTEGIDAWQNASDLS